MVFSLVGCSVTVTVNNHGLSGVILLLSLTLNIDQCSSHHQNSFPALDFFFFFAGPFFRAALHAHKVNNRWSASTKTTVVLVAETGSNSPSGLWPSIAASCYISFSLGLCIFKAKIIFISNKNSKITQDSMFMAIGFSLNQLWPSPGICG